VVTAEDLRQHLNGHRALVLDTGTIVTPLAEDHLRTHGIRVMRRGLENLPETVHRTQTSWGLAQDQTYPVVSSVVAGLKREGLAFRDLSGKDRASPCRWARSLAECIAGGECQGGILFCQEPGLICCVANKVAGLRAVAATTVADADRACHLLAPNLVAVTMPGRTFFEVRQILRTLCRPQGWECPAEPAVILQELDGHAHR
jgi:ribose 5-phosphate isomerase RpiB